MLNDSACCERQNASIPVRLKLNQWLEVVARHHHGHDKICPCLTDSADQLAAHLFNAAEVLTRRGFWQCACSAFPAVPKGDGCAFALDAVAVSPFFQLRFPATLGSPLSA